MFEARSMDVVRGAPESAFYPRWPCDHRGVAAGVSSGLAVAGVVPARGRVDARARWRRSSDVALAVVVFVL
mgnify:CR=1 FL=1